MGRFDFKSPGAAFVDEITQVLAERKAEERQRLLDQITQAQEARAERESLANTEYRNKTLDLQNKQFGLQERNQLLQELGMATENLSPGEDPRTAGVGQQYIDAGKPLGMFRERPAPVASVTTDIGEVRTEGGETASDDAAPETSTQPSALPPSLEYTGGKDEVKRVSQAKKQGALITEMLSSDDPARKRLGQAMAAIASLNNGVVPESMMAALASRLIPGQNAQVFNEETGTWSTGPEIQNGAQVVVRGRPPYNAASRPRWDGATTSEGFPIIEHPDGSLSVDESVGPVGGKDTSEGPLGIPVGLINTHRESVIALSGDPEPEDLEAFRYTANAVISAARTASSRVKQLAMMFVADPVAGTKALLKAELTPTEEAQYTQLLQATRADTFKEKLLVSKGTAR